MLRDLLQRPEELVCSPQQNVHSEMYRSVHGIWSAANASVDEVEWLAFRITCLLTSSRAAKAVIVDGGAFAFENL